MQTPVIEPGCTGRDGRTGLLVRWPYDADFNEIVKSRFPYADRYWTDTAWWIAAGHADELTALLLARFGGVQVLGLNGEPDVLIDRDGSSVAQPRLAL